MPLAVVMKDQVEEMNRLGLNVFHISLDNRWSEQELQTSMCNVDIDKYKVAQRVGVLQSGQKRYKRAALGNKLSV